MKDFRKEGMGGDMNEMNFGDVGWGGWWRIYERIDTLLVYGMEWNGMDFFFFCSGGGRRAKRADGCRILKLWL